MKYIEIDVGLLNTEGGPVIQRVRQKALSRTSSGACYQKRASKGFFSTGKATVVAWHRNPSEHEGMQVSDTHHSGTETNSGPELPCLCGIPNNGEQACVNIRKADGYRVLTWDRSNKFYCCVCRSSWDPMTTRS